MHPSARHRHLGCGTILCLTWTCLLDTQKRLSICSMQVLQAVQGSHSDSSTCSCQTDEALKQQAICNSAAATFGAEDFFGQCMHTNLSASIIILPPVERPRKYEFTNDEEARYTWFKILLLWRNVIQLALAA